MTNKPSRTFRISGEGDRFLYASGVNGCVDELNASNNPHMNDGGYVARMLLTSAVSGEGLAIHAIYDGNWSFALSPADPDCPFPTWPIRRQWGGQSLLSESIEIDVPSDTKFLLAEPLEVGPSSYAPIPGDRVIVRPPPFLRSEIYRFLIIVLLFSIFMLPPVAYGLLVENIFKKHILFAFYPLVATLAAYWLAEKKYPRIDYTTSISRQDVAKHG